MSILVRESAPQPENKTRHLDCCGTHSPACSCCSNWLGSNREPRGKNKPHSKDKTKNGKRQIVLTKRVVSFDACLRQQILRLLLSTRALFSPFERVQWRGYSTSSPLAGGIPLPCRAKCHAAFARQATSYVTTASIAHATTTSTASTPKYVQYTSHEDTYKTWECEAWHAIEQYRLSNTPMGFAKQHERL